MEVQNINVKDVYADDHFNCRGEITPTDLVELAKDIDQKGLIQPIILSALTEERQQETGKKYLLVAGYRRFYAVSKVLRGSTILGIVRDELVDELSARLFNLSENLQRKQLTILQEAKAIEGLRKLNLAREVISKKVGKSPGWVQIRIMLLELPHDLQVEIDTHQIKQSAIRDVYTMYKYHGRDAAVDAVRKLKDAKIAGKDANVKKHIDKSLKTKRVRGKGEIMDMMEHLQQTIQNGLHTRILAWVGGEINDLEIYESIEEYAGENGIEYSRPKQAA